MSAAPPLLGYNLVTAKPGTLVGLSSPDGDPLLAHGRYGLGRTVAFMGDDRARWASDWLIWNQFPRFWAQTVRWALRSPSNADYQASTSLVGGRGHLSVEMLHGASGSTLTASVVAPDLSVHSVALTQTSPGHYDGAFSADQTGAYMASVRPAPSSSAANAAFLPTQTVGLVVPYSPEYRTLGANLPLLTQIAEGTGGKVQPDASQVFREAPVWTAGILDLAPALLLLCALLWVGDIAVRRLGWRLPSRDKRTVALSENGIPVSLSNDNLENREARDAPFPPIRGRQGKSSPVKPRETSSDVLSRRAVPVEDEDDNPFPFVASLKNRGPRDE